MKPWKVFTILIQSSLLIREFLNLRDEFSDFDLNSFLLLFSRLIREFPNTRIFSTVMN